MSAAGICPGCGSPLVFRVATTTTAVCGFCQSIVVRAGAGVDLVGKTNAVLVTGSVLHLGLTGAFSGRAFSIVGRTQLQHDLGGVWDEWLLAFDDGRLAWLAEHQGRLALMAEHKVQEAPQLASPADATPGSSHLSSIGELIVVERGEATLIAEEGELPGRSLPGARRPFIDFSSRNGRFATLDFGAVQTDGTREGRRFFVGKEVTLAQLGLAAAVVQEAKLPQAMGSTALRCPHCGAPVEKKLQTTETLSCGHCGSVLAVSADNQLGMLFAQESLRFSPIVPLGTKAVLDEGFFQRSKWLGEQPRPWPTRLAIEVVAHVVRSVVVDGERYHFFEYLLHAEKHGFFWLVESDGKWLFVRSLEAGLVSEQPRRAMLEGKTFNLEQQNRARIEQVTGELYWKVNKGDSSMLTDYRHAPRTLSKESTANEVIWTECLDVTRADVVRVFGLSLAGAARLSDEGGGKGEGGGSAQTELPTGCAVAVVVALILMFLMMATCDDCGGGSSGGGGHYSSGGGTGFSFGK